MFGRIAKARLNKKKFKQSQAQKAQEKIDAETKLANEPAEKQAMQDTANANAQKMKEQQRIDREQGYADAERLISETKGFTPEQKALKESDAQQRLNNDMQGYQRNITSRQGASGIKGGAAYAQNADLAKLGMQAQGQFQSDLAQLDQDLALKKAAAKYSIGQGNATQNQLNQQIAEDTEQTEKERKRQQALEDQVNKILARL